MDAQFSLDTKIKVGIIGFGRMGRFYWEAMRKSGRWEIAYICDTDPTTRELAKKISPESLVVENDQKIFEDESVQVVGHIGRLKARTNRKGYSVRKTYHRGKTCCRYDGKGVEGGGYDRKLQCTFYGKLISAKFLVS